MQYAKKIDLYLYFYICIALYIFFPAKLGACMHFENNAGNFSSAVRRPFGHDSAVMSKLVALSPNSMHIVHDWSEKGVPTSAR